MQIYNLVMHNPSFSHLPVPEMNPLAEPLALREATLLEVLDIILFKRVALLLDLRTALYLNAYAGNTGVLICNQVIDKKHRYSSGQHFPPPSVYTIADCHVIEKDAVYSLDIDINLTITCRSISFFSGNVADIAEVAESLDESLEAYLNTTPHWGSTIDLTGYAVAGTRHRLTGKPGSSTL